MTTDKVFLANAAGFAKALGTINFNIADKHEGRLFRPGASHEKTDVNKRK